MNIDQERPPSVDSMLRLVRKRVDAGLDRDAVLAIARAVQAEERDSLAAGQAARSPETLAQAVIERLAAPAGAQGAGTVSVINATGVIVHTNLGRATWPQAAIDAATRAVEQPLLLELDRSSGRRGHRYRAGEDHLIALSGAEDALITNNNAAALALAVGLARRRGVVVSRGELVEIGGGVRIPEIVRRAGARLVEVGTTNRTRAADYEPALVEGRGVLVLRVHRSNFRQEGFVESPDPRSLAELARRHDAPLVDDLGSGALIDTAAFGLAHEPTPRERLEAGADIVTFSGDKLLGGPQAGLIAGRADLIARMRRDPLARAMRPDKATLAAVAATLGLYRAGRATLDIPVWRSIATDTADLRDRARAMVSRLGAPDGVETVETQATVGGGALPGETLPSVGLRIRRGSASQLMKRLRLGDPCVVARAQDGSVILDLRTVAPQQYEGLESALAVALGIERA
ncbi:MAG: L-seryl-tRNA(Sec) selenium transferase [Chloroflexota bacterium]